jgi:hypothetical protein
LHQVTTFAALFAVAPFFRIPPVLAFLCLSALLLASAVPIALAWARVIPSDDPEDSPSVPTVPRGSVSFLVLVSLSFAARLPGVPRAWLGSWLLGYFPADWAPWLILTAQIILILIPGLVALYAAFRTKPVNQPLLWSGLLVAFLWLVTPLLTKSWLGAAVF